MTLEIIAFNVPSCAAAEVAGAQRIELCDNPAEGGTTPSYGFIKEARKILSIPLFPIIRPRGGDFLYSDEEFECIKNDIIICKNLGCDGVVTGLLKADGTIDKKRTEILVKLAYPLPLTFHRAFDRVMDAEQALEDCIEVGCKRILTSGLFANVDEGLQNLKKLMVQANERIIIMPGSGVRAGNIKNILEETGAKEIHSSVRKLIPSLMNYKNPNLTETLQTYFVDEEEIKQMRQIMLQN